MPPHTLPNCSYPTDQVLIQCLLEQGALDSATLDQVNQQVFSTGFTWVQAALSLSAVEPLNLARALKQTLGYALFDDSGVDINRCVLDLWSPVFCIEHQLLAWRTDDGTHHIATADPTNNVVMTQAQAQLDQPARWWVAAHDQLERDMQRWQQRWEWQVPTTPVSGGNPPVSHLPTPEERAIEDVPVVKLLHELMSKAHRMRASDLHIEPYEHHVRVRWRIDGHLHEMCSVPLDMRDGLASRLKVLARLDIAEKRLPQDGRVEFHLNGERVHGRVNSLPTVFGEKLVVRLLPNTPVHRQLDELGMELREQGDLLHALSRPQGMVLVHRSNRLGENRHLVRLFGQSQPAPCEHRHRRRPLRDARPRHQPTSSARQSRADVCHRPARLFAARPRCVDGR